MYPEEFDSQESAVELSEGIAALTFEALTLEEQDEKESLEAYGRRLKKSFYSEKPVLQKQLAKGYTAIMNVLSDPDQSTKH